MCLAFSDSRVVFCLFLICFVLGRCFSDGRLCYVSRCLLPMDFCVVFRCCPLREFMLCFVLYLIGLKKQWNVVESELITRSLFKHSA